MTTFAPGNSISTATVDSGDLQNIDGSLIDTNGDYIIDSMGNTISIGGGHDGGDDVTSATLTPGDEPTTIYTGAGDPTAVTWG